MEAHQKNIGRPTNLKSFISDMQSSRSGKTIQSHLKGGFTTRATFQEFADYFCCTYTELQAKLQAGEYSSPALSGTQDLIKANLSGRWKGILFQTEGPMADSALEGHYFEIELFVIHNDQGGTAAVVCYEIKNGEVRHSAGADIFLRSILHETETCWIFRRWAHQRFGSSKDPSDRKGREPNVPEFYWWKITPAPTSGPPKLDIEIELHTSYIERQKSPKPIMWKGTLALYHS